MFLFSLTTGGLIGLSLIAVDENLGLKVTSLTAIATLITALVGMYSGIDFSFLGKFLFFALLGLIIVSFIRIFFTIKGISKKIIAFIGIAIFIGYLLLDFNNLNKAGKLSTINNWVTALDYSVNIYLDIINLFLYILDAMSD